MLTIHALGWNQRYDYRSRKSRSRRKHAYRPRVPRAFTLCGEFQRLAVIGTGPVTCFACIRKQLEFDAHGRCIQTDFTRNTDHVFASLRGARLRRELRTNTRHKPKT